MTDLDRLAAAIDRLRAQFCQGAENVAAPPLSDVCERVVRTGDGDSHLETSTSLPTRSI